MSEIIKNEEDIILTEEMKKEIELARAIQRCICNGNYFVYKHVDPLGKVYIGITKRMPTERWLNGHAYRHQNKRLTVALELNDFSKWEHVIIEADLTKEEAETLENKYILEYKSHLPEYGYNVAVRKEKDKPIVNEVDDKEAFDLYVQREKGRISTKLYDYFINYLSIVNPSKEMKECVFEKMKTSKYKFPQVEQYFDEWLEEQIMIHEEEIDEKIKLRKAYVEEYNKNLMQMKGYLHNCSDSVYAWQLETQQYLLDTKFVQWSYPILSNKESLPYYKKFLDFVFNNNCDKQVIVLDLNNKLMELFDEELFTISTKLFEFPVNKDFKEEESQFYIPAFCYYDSIEDYYHSRKCKIFNRYLKSKQRKRIVIELNKECNDLLKRLSEEIDKLLGNSVHECDDMRISLDVYSSFIGSEHKRITEACDEQLEYIKLRDPLQHDYVMKKSGYYGYESGFSVSELKEVYDKITHCCSHKQFSLIKYLASKYDIALKTSVYISKREAGMLIDYLNGDESSEEHERVVVKMLQPKNSDRAKEILKLFE